MSPRNPLSLSWVAAPSPAAQEKLAALSGPQDDLYRRAQQLEQALKEKQAQLSAAAKQVGSWLHCRTPLLLAAWM